MEKSFAFYESVQGLDSNLLPLIALFEETFLIDWVVELTNMKIWETLAVLEQQVQAKVLSKKEPGIYSFSSPEKRQKVLDQLSGEEKEQGHRLVARLFMSKLPDEDGKAQALSPHLLQISNDPETCCWLLRAGDVNLRVFRNEDALQCYKKILDDLSGLEGDEVDSLFIEAAVKYSKISIGRDDTEKIVDFLYEAIERAKRRGKNKHESLLEMHLAKNKWLLSKYRSALKHFEHGWRIAKNLNDPNLLRSARTFSTFLVHPTNAYFVS